MANSDQKLFVTITNSESELLDRVEVFTEAPKNTVKLIVAQIEENHWTDEESFDEFLAEARLLP